KPGERHVLAYLRADGRKGLGECHDMPVFGALSYLAKIRMIAVLLAASGIPACGLDVPIRERTNPDVAPGRRDRKRLDAPEHVGLCQPGSVSTRVGEALS